ncbi:MAG: hypothetical protein ACI8UD_000952, partial [Planctomycetota bacterium]
MQTDGPRTSDRARSAWPYSPRLLTFLRRGSFACDITIAMQRLGFLFLLVPMLVAYGYFRR